MMKNKTLINIMVGLVIVFMAVMIISLLDTNYELSTELSEKKQAYDELNGEYSELSNEYSELSNEYIEVSDDYDNLVKGIHNKFNNKEYEIKYIYNGKNYTYSYDGKLFGNRTIGITY